MIVTMIFDIISSIEQGIALFFSHSLDIIILFPLVAIFWPFILSIVVALGSVSSWIFWLLTSITVGAIQFFYALYQMCMIGIDICVLSILKTFALMRSYMRYYSIEFGFRKRNVQKDKRRGRRREWRKKLDAANDYESFMKIEIEEPDLMPNEEENHAEVESDKKNTDQKFLKRRNLGLSPKQSKNSIPRAQSCVELEHDTIPSPTRPNRTNSTNDMQQKLAEYEEHDLEKELGKDGGFIVTTTARLREARLQASAAAGSRKQRISIIDENDADHDGDGGGNDGNAEDELTVEDGETDSDGLEGGISGENKYGSAISELKYLLSGVIKRNHLSVNDLLMADSASVMESGKHTLSSKARDVILGYHEEVERCLELVADSPLNAPLSVPELNSPTDKNNLRNSDLTIKTSGSVMSPRSGSSSPKLPQSFDVSPKELELNDSITMLRRIKLNMGNTALMLSGGGAQAMYHLGTLKALCESNIYNDIEIISGTSGGAISAAMCAFKTQEELLEHICIPTVSTDFMLTGEMKRLDIRWFPRLLDMGAYWMKNGHLVDPKLFKETCEYYYGDITFEEAFLRTKKHVCISVSASRAMSKSAQRLLLNHISTPHVTLASAVQASCSLPGLMPSAKLRIKNSRGEIENFEVDGVEWIDGSVQADLPFKRLSTLFNVSSYIVCQTNFHVRPFLHKPHHPNMKTIYWKIFQTCEWDVRNRALNLGRLGLFPKIFGQDMTKVFKQKYHGDLTLVPRFTTLQTFGLKAVVNPSESDMKQYLQDGQSAAWPYLGLIREMLRQERAIDRCLAKLTEQKREILPDDDDWDDVGSILSGTQSNRSKPTVYHREIELLKQKILALELENSELSKKLTQEKRT